MKRYGTRFLLFSKIKPGGPAAGFIAFTAAVAVGAAAFFMAPWGTEPYGAPGESLSGNGLEGQDPAVAAGDEAYPDGIPANGLGKSRKTGDGEISPSRSTDSDGREDEGRRYRLMEVGGTLAVFEDGEKEPVWFTHMPVSNLPEKERKRLSGGIEFSSMMEVLSYLESITS